MLKSCTSVVKRVKSINYVIYLSNKTIFPSKLATDK